MSEANALMNNPVFVAALSKARDQAISAAMACAPNDDDGRWRYLEGARVVDSVFTHVRALIESEKASDAEKQHVRIADHYTVAAQERWDSVRSAA